jgi:hypothetical protein
MIEDDLQKDIFKVLKQCKIPYVHAPRQSGKRRNQLSGLPDIVTPRLQIELKSPQLNAPTKHLRKEQREWRQWASPESYLLSNKKKQILQKILDTYKDKITMWDRLYIKDIIEEINNGTSNIL